MVGHTDEASGGPGKDTLYGSRIGIVMVRLNGGVGDDTLTLTGIMCGGPGHDTLDSQDRFSRALMSGDGGNDTMSDGRHMYGEEGNDKMSEGGEMYGGEGMDTMSDGGWMLGEEGQHELQGGDIVWGGDDGDLLDGGG
jgi:hypothetical protein